MLVRLIRAPGDTGEAPVDSTGTGADETADVDAGDVSDIAEKAALRLRAEVTVARVIAGGAGGDLAAIAAATTADAATRSGDMTGLRSTSLDTDPNRPEPTRSSPAGIDTRGSNARISSCPLTVD